MKIMIKLIIFDCDGVVIDSEIIAVRLLANVLNHQGVTIDENYVLRHFLGRSFNTMREHVAQRFDVVLPEKLNAQYRQALLDLFETSLELTSDFHALLESLTVPFCLATSSTRARTEAALHIVGLTKAFTGKVFTADDVENGKPAPDLFLHAAKSMETSPALCLAIEDSPVGLEAAQAANMQVLNYQGGAHFTSLKKLGLATNKTHAVLHHWRDFSTFYPEIVQEK